MKNLQLTLYIHVEELKLFFTGIKNKAMCSILSLLFNIELEVLAIAIEEEKQIK